VAESQPNGLGGRRRGAQLRRDRVDLGRGPMAEEREREVEVSLGNDANLARARERAKLPLDEPGEGIVGESEGAEEADSLIPGHAS